MTQRVGLLWWPSQILTPLDLVGLRQVLRGFDAPFRTVGIKHRHPGPVVAYVLSGVVDVHLHGQSPKSFHAGESFSKDARQLRVSTRYVSKMEPVRQLSYIRSHTGEAHTEPVK